MSKESVVIPVGLVEDIVRFESGEMGFEETADFFQRLIDTGLAWELQGFYGRQAEEAIKAGVCSGEVPSGGGYNE